MKWIEVAILCHNDATKSLEAAGLPVDNLDFDIRPCKINTERIVAYFPSRVTGFTICNFESDSFEVDMSFNDFDKLIQ